MDFKIKNYLPLFFIVLGSGFVLIGIFGIIEKPGVSLTLILAGILFTTTQNRLEINRNRKYYRKYVWILGIKYGEKIAFDELQYIYITKSRRSQVYGQSYKNHSFIGEHFNVYLKLSDRDKVLIGDGSSRDWVLKKIAKINKQLALEVRDYSNR
jgi:hypothetical protein